MTSVLSGLYFWGHTGHCLVLANPHEPLGNVTQKHARALLPEGTPTKAFRSQGKKKKTSLNQSFQFVMEDAFIQ